MYAAIYILLMTILILLWVVGVALSHNLKITSNEQLIQRLATNRLEIEIVNLTDELRAKK